MRSNLRKELRRLIAIITTGSREEVQSAKKELERLWYRHFNESRPYEEFFRASRNFSAIRSPYHRASFLQAFKWAILALGNKDRYFPLITGLIKQAIEDESGTVRYAAVKAASYLKVTIPFDSVDSQKPSLSQQKVFLRGRDRYFSFVEEVEIMLQKHSRKSYERIKYIDELPTGVYKSLELLFAELVPGKYYEEMYAEYRYEKEKRKMMLSDCLWRRTFCGRGDCAVCGKIKIINKKMDGSREGMNNLDEALRRHLFDISRLAVEAARMQELETEAEKIHSAADGDWAVLREIGAWRDFVFQIAQHAFSSRSLWLRTEDADDLLWYANMFYIKSYELTHHRVHLKRGESLLTSEEEAHARYVLGECIGIVKRALANLASFRSPQKGELLLALSRFSGLEKKI